MLQTKSYVFPTLKSQDILQCMADLQIPFSEEDITKPNPQRIAYIYESFLEILMGITRDQFELHNFAVLEVSEYPEFQQDSLSGLSFFRQLKKLMTRIGIDDFSMRDLIKPEPGHVKRVLSGIINFAKFREERMNTFEILTRKTDEYMEQKQILQEETQEQIEQLNTLRLQRAEEESDIKAAKELNMSLRTDLMELKKQQTDIAKAIEGLKETKNDYADKLTTSQFNIMNCKQEIQIVNSRIVHSPEKLKQMLIDLTASLGNAKSQINENDKKYRDYQSKLSILSTVEKDIEQTYQSLEEYGECKEKLDLLKQQIQKANELKEKSEHQLHDLNIKEQQLTRQLASLNEKRLRLQKQQDSKRGDVQSHMKHLQDEYSTLSTERAEIQAKIDENKIMMDQYEQKTSELRKRWEMEQSTIFSDYMSVKQQIETYQADLSNAMSLFQP